MKVENNKQKWRRHARDKARDEQLQKVIICYDEPHHDVTRLVGETPTSHFLLPWASTTTWQEGVKQSSTRVEDFNLQFHLQLDKSIPISFRCNFAYCFLLSSITCDCYVIELHLWSWIYGYFYYDNLWVILLGGR